MQKALVSVTGQDQVGIIAKVSASLSEQNINILEISQTILDGYIHTGAESEGYCLNEFIKVITV